MEKERGERTGELGEANLLQGASDGEDTGLNDQPGEQEPAEEEVAAPGYSVLRERQNISEEESQLLLSPPQVQPLSPGSVQAPADLPEFDLLDPHQETGPARPMKVKPIRRRPPSLRRGSNCVSHDTTVSEFLNPQKNPTSRQFKMTNLKMREFKNNLWRE